MTSDSSLDLNVINDDFLKILKERIALRESELANSAAAASEAPCEANPDSASGQGFLAKKGKKKYRDLVRSHARLNKIHDKTVAFLLLKKESEDCRRMLADEKTEAEMKQLAQEDLSRLEKDIADALRSLLLELYPPGFP